MASSREVLVEDLPPELLASTPSEQSFGNWEEALKLWVDNALSNGQKDILDQAVPKFERIMIETALAHTAGRRRDASLLLGWGRNTLTRKIKELGIDNTDSDDE
jgi:two-component system nitrogen regulation response regulator GlnG